MGRQVALEPDANCKEFVLAVLSPRRGHSSARFAIAMKRIGRRPDSRPPNSSPLRRGYLHLATGGFHDEVGRFRDHYGEV